MHHSRDSLPSMQMTHASAMPHQVTHGLRCHQFSGILFLVWQARGGPTDPHSHLLGGGCGCEHDCIGAGCRRQGPPGVQAPVAEGVGGCWSEQRREVVLHPCAGQVCVQQPGVHSDGCIFMLASALIPAASPLVIREWQYMGR